MTLPASGPISMQQVITELGQGAGPGPTFDMGRLDVRGLANRLSGTVGFGDLQGKTCQNFSVTTGVSGGSVGYSSYGAGFGSVSPFNFAAGAGGATNWACWAMYIDSLGRFVVGLEAQGVGSFPTLPFNNLLLRAGTGLGSAPLLALPFSGATVQGISSTNRTYTFATSGSAPPWANGQNVFPAILY